ncbi:hypothetical protein Chor_010474, partial [Crotalus horridus]
MRSPSLLSQECRKNECCRKDCKFRKDIDCLYGLCCEKCKEMNTRGDRFGNCGKDGSVYRKCLEKDVLCGRVQCVNVGKISRVATRQDVLQTPVEGATCWGTEFDLGVDVYDLGAVQDGTSCGPDKVCNSNRNCHCSYGWAPPLCTDPGFGGSIDSGPPPPYQ